LTQWDNIPTLIISAVFLDMSANFWAVIAKFYWAPTWYILSADFFPMIKPAAATTFFITGTVKIVYFHPFLIYIFMDDL